VNSFAAAQLGFKESFWLTCLSSECSVNDVTLVLVGKAARCFHPFSGKENHAVRYSPAHGTLPCSLCSAMGSSGLAFNVDCTGCLDLKERTRETGGK